MSVNDIFGAICRMELNYIKLNSSLWLFQPFVTDCNNNKFIEQPCKTGLLLNQRYVLSGNITTTTGRILFFKNFLFGVTEFVIIRLFLCSGDFETS